MPRLFPFDDMRPDFVIKLPPPVCPTPWGCADCQHELLRREAISPLPERTFDLTDHA